MMWLFAMLTMSIPPPVNAERNRGFILKLNGFVTLFPRVVTGDSRFTIVASAPPSL